MANSMLYASRLSPILWPAAVSHANMLRNRLPIHSLGTFNVQTNVATAIAAAVTTQYDAARQNEPSSPNCDRLQTLNDKIIRFLEADVQALCPIDEAITPITLMLSLIVPGSNTGSILLAMTKDTFRDEYKLDFFGSFGSLLVGTPISPSETPSAYLARIITLAKSGKQLRPPFPLEGYGITCDTNGAPAFLCSQWVVRLVCHELACRRAIDHGCSDVSKDHRPTFRNSKLLKSTKETTSASSFPVPTSNKSLVQTAPTPSGSSQGILPPPARHTCKQH
jgi:hypothetical protein